MARPIKEGLDYFSMDVDFYDDPKIIYAEEAHGVIGGYIASRLLCLIYREGYFIKWDDDMALVFSKRIGNGLTHTQVKEVVTTLIEKGFFDKGLFTKFSILSSRGIQKRWLRIISDCKRKAGINSLYDVVNSVIAEFPSEETTPIREESTQSKVKESKVNNNPLPPRGAVSASSSEQGEIPGGQNNDPKEPAAWLAAFEIFWEAYGKRRDRSKCERRFKNLSKAEREAIFVHVPKYVASTPEIQYRKNPLTYLNGKCWEDEDLPSITGGGKMEPTENGNPGQRKYEMVY